MKKVKASVDELDISSLNYYYVIILVNNKSGKLLPGMTANVNFIKKKKDNVFTVPNTALLFTPTSLTNAEKDRLLFEAGLPPDLGKAVSPVYSGDNTQNPVAIIELRGIKRYYSVGDIVVKALGGVDLDVEEGEFLAIMGPSGSGKSTLMNTLGYLDKPTGEVRLSSTYVVGGPNYWSTSVYGVEPDYLKIKDWPIRAGSFFTNNDLQVKSKVAVIGTTVAEKLFPDKDPVGQSIRILTTPLTVIGVLASKGANTMGSDQDDVVNETASYGYCVRRAGARKYRRGRAHLGSVRLSFQSFNSLRAGRY